MTKQATPRRARLVRLGDAKRLTQGDNFIGTELNGKVEPQG